MALNTVIMDGRMVNDIELRQTTNGKKVASFRFANDAGKDANGQRKAEFFTVNVWDNVAEYLAKYARKGSYLTIVGSLRTRQYTDKAGNNRISVEITAHQAQLPPRPNTGAQGQAAPAQAPAQSQAAAPTYNQAPAQQASGTDDFEDVPESEDLPF
jgi:single-strand DNA-binding protein